jgi:hypothetical protein
VTSSDAYRSYPAANALPRVGGCALGCAGSRLTSSRGSEDEDIGELSLICFDGFDKREGEAARAGIYLSRSD